MTTVKLIVAVLLPALCAAAQFVVFTHVDNIKPFQYITLAQARVAHPLPAQVVLIHHVFHHPGREDWNRNWDPSASDVKFLEKLSIQLVKYRFEDETAEHSTILRNWRNASVTPPFIEHFCMLRFASLAHFAKQQPPGSTFVHGDLDIVFMMNVFTSLPYSHWFVGSYLAVWDSPLLSEFVKYAVSFYTANVTTQANVISTYGEPVSGKLEEILDGYVSSWWPLARDQRKNWCV